MYRCIDDHDDLSFVNLSMYLLLGHIQDLYCLNLSLICLGFITHLTGSSCTIILLTNLDTIVWKNAYAFNDIQVRLEAIIFEEGQPFIEIMYNFQRTWSEIDRELDR